jgi:hypothetical protein
VALKFYKIKIATAIMFFINLLHSSFSPYYLPIFLRCDGGSSMRAVVAMIADPGAWLPATQQRDRWQMTV